MKTFKDFSKMNIKNQKKFILSNSYVVKVEYFCRAGNPIRVVELYEWNKNFSEEVIDLNLIPLRFLLVLKDYEGDGIFTLINVLGIEVQLGQKTPYEIKWCSLQAQVARPPHIPCKWLLMSEDEYNEFLIDNNLLHAFL